ncbi:hypothetical protein GCM10011492_31510 [Flexivirga endophytica]|uniref:Uncharacterized protein n=1 Tax=Flexivirga endophytica TaxID=1849103 RepID=A0A916TCJ7_9MICO|nr:hypothetical protein [Flexivirga endophytica]GGB38444.1 hypothetical protein GCM10011492_31510 [Flexivirga endophytica]GHB46445.1 hypothetical protein GCM10008112_13900 [Flexivirga endophytica]
MSVLVRFIILIVIVAAVVYGLRTLRPKLREQRHRRWEEAGLLPHQVDPYAPKPKEEDDTDQDGEHR